MSLFIGRLNPDVRLEEIEDAFGKYGQLRRCDHKGNFAFVTYEDERDAEDAIRNLHNSDIGSARINVEWARGGGRRSDVCYECGEVGHFARDCVLRVGPGGMGNGGRDAVPGALRGGPPPRGDYGRRRSPSPRGYRRSPPRGYRSPRRYSRSPPRRYSRSPPRRYSRSPPRRYSRSPPRRYSRSPPRRERSPRRSRSPPMRGSRSPPPRRSPSPRRRSPSPRRRSPSPRRRSPSPRRRSPSPRRRSPSPGSPGAGSKRGRGDEGAPAAKAARTDEE